MHKETYKGPKNRAKAKCAQECVVTPAVLVGFYYWLFFIRLCYGLFFFHIQITPALVLHGALLCRFCLELYMKRETKRDPKTDPQKSLFSMSLYDSLCKSLFHIWYPPVFVLHGAHLCALRLQLFRTLLLDVFQITVFRQICQIRPIFM